MGRPRNFEDNELVLHKRTGQLYVVVGHEIKPNGNGMYRVVPMTNPNSRGGPATSIEGYLLHAPWSLPPRSYRQGSADTYEANEKLNEWFEHGRGCRCQCCPHFKQTPKAVLDSGQVGADDGGAG